MSKTAKAQQLDTMPTSHVLRMHTETNRVQRCLYWDLEPYFFLESDILALRDPAESQELIGNTGVSQVASANSW